MKNISSPAGSAKFGRIGDSIPRVEDQRLLTGRGCYTDDAGPSGCLHAAYVRSPHAHARIRKIDPTAALALPGVSVMTGADLEAAGVRPVLNPPESLGAGFPSFTGDLVIPPWRALAVGKVRHLGEAVALVIAPTELRRARCRRGGAGRLRAAGLGDRDRRRGETGCAARVGRDSWQQAVRHRSWRQDGDRSRVCARRCGRRDRGHQ